MGSSLVFLSFVLLISSASAFNITRILNNQSDFSTFNSLLSQHHLASEINARQTITVLVVDNGAISALSGSPPDVQKNILRVHVILDYYDKEKLMASSNKSRLVTTLFQSSGLATNQQGFINITVDKSSDAVKLGSAVPGSTLDSSLVGEVTTRPYNISVLQISNLIIPAGIDKLNPKAKAPASVPSKAPSKSPAKASSPAGSPSEAPAPVADAPEADSPSDAPESSEAPAADGPSADGPGKGGADGPSADGPDADGSGAWAGRVALGTCLGVIVGVFCMAFQ